MKMKEVTVKLSGVVFAQVILLSTAGSFFTELRTNETGASVWMWLSLAASGIFVTCMSALYLNILNGIKKRKK